jgi:Ankyrin repeats (3 copies)
LCAPALWTAASLGQPEEVLRLLAGGADIQEKGGRRESSALHEAIRGSHTQVVRLLLQHGVDVSIKKTDGVTPLHEAMRTGDREMVSLLLQHGADVTSKQWRWRKPLHIAAFNGHPLAVELLELLHCQWVHHSQARYEWRGLLLEISTVTRNGHSICPSPSPSAPSTIGAPSVCHFTPPRGRPTVPICTPQSQVSTGVDGASTHGPTVSLIDTRSKRFQCRSKPHLPEPPVFVSSVPCPDAKPSEPRRRVWRGLQARSHNGPKRTLLLFLTPGQT